MRFLVVLILMIPAGLAAQGEDGGTSRGGLTIVALGNTGETGSILRGNASYLADMYSGVHDAGVYDVLVFLGNNFFETGLNVPADDVEPTIRSLLGPFQAPMAGLGRANVHAIPGSHDYYARAVLERSVLFGLFTINEGVEGISGRGNQRAALLEHWTYHHAMPAESIYPLQPGGAPSPDSVQLIFFDSALLLRTEAAAWRPALDSLRSILDKSRSRPGIAWRLFCTHHPLRSVGEHGGYSLWNDELQSVEYLSPCSRDSNASGWLRNWIEPQDLCADRYQAYIDSVRRILAQSGVPVHAVLASHDYSLQLLHDPAGMGTGMPAVHIVSGTGARVARVKRPAPPYEYTGASPDPLNEGRSLFGFAQLRFGRDCMRVTFFNGKNGEPIDMGGGAEQFCVRKDGTLTVGEYVKSARGE